VPGDTCRLTSAAADRVLVFKQWEQAKVTEVMLAALREQVRVRDPLTKYPCT
jgi:hypothetical protein